MDAPGRSGAVPPASSPRHFTSTPPSPTLSRYYRSTRRGSNAEEYTAPAAVGAVGTTADERTALLQGPRSRAHIRGGASARLPLSRNHSYSGTMGAAAGPSAASGGLPRLNSGSFSDNYGTLSRHHSRAGSWGQRLIHALSDRQLVGSNEVSNLSESKGSLVPPDERVWYDQFTSTDWVHDSILDAYRAKALRSRKGFWGRVIVLFDGVQGWVLSALVGFVVAVLAYCIDVSEAVAFDWKDGYCATAWYRNEKSCCPRGACTDWREWGEVLSGRRSGVGEPSVGDPGGWHLGVSPDGSGNGSAMAMWAEYGAYICGVIFFASLACLLTLTTRTVVSSTYRLSTLDENLAADPVPAPPRDEDDSGEGGVDSEGAPSDDEDEHALTMSGATNGTDKNGANGAQGTNGTNGRSYGATATTTTTANKSTAQATVTATGTSHAANLAAHQSAPSPPMVYFSAAGSGVAEVRVILSGFVLHGFLGFKTLVVKSVGLVLSVASGLSLGKEGPYVHIATCVGNIACRLFSKYDQNDAKRREVLSAAAAAGVAVAFGAPLGGVLFCLEEVAYFFPAKTLFRTFFCCITAALTLKFLNPYGTHKIVMFQVHYAVDWQYFELISFVGVGVLGGVAGALFIKASRQWAKSFRTIPLIKAHPLLEVVLVALVTGLVGYWNGLTKLPVADLLYNLAAPCDERDNNLSELGICPAQLDDIPPILLKLLGAFLIKGVLTIVTFGIKVPAGIYVPSMVVGGLMGRLVGHVVQYVVLRFHTWPVWGKCASTGDASCIQPGVYGLIAAGATMCGVTRLSVTLAVILFEITGSLDYVLPFSLAILVAKWTADAMEPLSIYDLLTEMNSYPFLNNKHKPLFTTTLGDLISGRPGGLNRRRVIDVSSSPLVRATVLRQKLEMLHRAGELDGGLPIVRRDVLVGLIPAPDLEFALDNLRDEAHSRCLMAAVPTIDDSDDEAFTDPTDFTPYIDPAPVALDIQSPMDLVYECFVKLGLRYICVSRDGRYAGMAHKKTFVKYIRDLEEREGRISKT